MTVTPEDRIRAHDALLPWIEHRDFGRMKDRTALALSEVREAADAAATERAAREASFWGPTGESIANLIRADAAAIRSAKAPEISHGILD